MKKYENISIGKNRDKRLKKIKTMEERRRELSYENRLTQKISKMFDRKILQLKNQLRKGEVK